MTIGNLHLPRTAFATTFYRTRVCGGGGGGGGGGQDTSPTGRSTRIVPRSARSSVRVRLYYFSVNSGRKTDNRRIFVF